MEVKVVERLAGKRAWGRQRRGCGREGQKEVWCVCGWVGGAQHGEELIYFGCVSGMRGRFGGFGIRGFRGDYCTITVLKL